MRIPLGRKVEHKWPPEKFDFLFFGKKFVVHPDKAVHLHVEMMTDSGDSYDYVDEYVGFVEASPSLRNIPEHVSINNAAPKGKRPSRVQCSFSQASRSKRQHHYQVNTA